MKAIRFGNEPEFHLLAFPKDGKYRELHSKCGIHPGVKDRIVQVKNLTPDDLCNTCWIRATARQKRKLKK